MGLNEKTRQTLLSEHDLSLDKCINISRASERAREHIMIFSKDNSVVEPMEINKILQQKNQKKINCKFCGHQHELNREKCPANGKTCFKCGKANHFSNVCKSNDMRRENVKIIEEDVEENDFEIE